jgi:hypothetical protein
MKSQITLIGDKISIDVDQPDFYESMLGAIAGRVFQLLGPGFDKEAFLKEVEKRGSAVVIGQELAVPVSILLSMELGYCLGQLKGMGTLLDCNKALEDLYLIWKISLKKMLDQVMIRPDSIH